jgi:hypothetical protein
MMVIATGVTAVALVFSIYLYRKKKPSKWVAITLGGIACLGLLLTYGRWEFLTWRYGLELERVAVIQFEAAGLPITTILRADDIAQLKVFSCYGSKAELFLRDQEGNKWLMELQRTQDDANWTAYHDGGWQIEMIHSVMGGSAHKSFYWY